MNPQLMTLLELQDLRAKLRELEAGGPAGSFETEHFNIDLDEAAAELRATLLEIEETLAPPVRRRYRRVLPHRDRVVVPVIKGVCYGCFVSIPTATAGEQDLHEELRTCENCGCFLYFAS
jgi:predicted  nucleic acid-binding Zn-ribbon protein